jgi:hypothetical protein
MPIISDCADIHLQNEHHCTELIKFKQICTTVLFISLKIKRNWLFRILFSYPKLRAVQISQGCYISLRTNLIRT